MRLLAIPDFLHKWGLEVTLEPGWEKRGKEFFERPKVAIGHHTATPRTEKNKNQDLPTRTMLRDGRSDLPGPLCQIATTRSGVIHVVAAGKANHAGQGDWKGITSSALTIGNEVEYPGTGEWNPAQLRAFDLSMAAMLDMLGQRAEMYCGHREWANPPGRKVDPGNVDLDKQRQRIKMHLESGPGRKTPQGDRWLGLENPPMRGQDVSNVQNALKIAGKLAAKDVDGIYGRGTADALTRFQRSAGIAERGCGPETWAALRKVVHGG